MVILTLISPNMFDQPLKLALARAKHTHTHTHKHTHTRMHTHTHTHNNNSLRLSVVLIVTNNRLTPISTRFLESYSNLQYNMFRKCRLKRVTVPPAHPNTQIIKSLLFFSNLRVNYFNIYLL